MWIKGDFYDESSPFKNRILDRADGTWYPQSAFFLELRRRHPAECVSDHCKTGNRSCLGQRKSKFRRDDAYPLSRERIEQPWHRFMDGLPVGWRGQGRRNLGKQIWDGAVKTFWLECQMDWRRLSSVPERAVSGGLLLQTVPDSGESGKSASLCHGKRRLWRVDWRKASGRLYSGAGDDGLPEAHPIPGIWCDCPACFTGKTHRRTPDWTAPCGRMVPR